MEVQVQLEPESAGRNQGIGAFRRLTAVFRILLVRGAGNRINLCIILADTDLKVGSHICCR